MGARAQLVAHVPFGSSTGLDPITQGLDASTQGLLPYAHHPYAFGHYYGKRSADAQLVAAVPFGSSTGLDPITQGLDASTQGYLPYAYHPYAFGHYYGKRSADADAYYAHHAVAYGVPFGSSTGLAPITQGLDASTQGLAPYAYHGYHYGKRSADADAYYAHGYGLAPYAHHAVAYGVPFGSSTGLDPITQG